MVISLGKAGDHLARGIGRERDGTQQIVQKSIAADLLAALHKLTSALHLKVGQVRLVPPRCQPGSAEPPHQ